MIDKFSQINYNNNGDNMINNVKKEIDYNEYYLSLDNIPKNDELTRIKEYALINKVPIILDDGLKVLLHTVSSDKNINVLEIGTAIGYSAINMALVNPNLYIDTIERNELMYNEAINNINRLNLKNRINVIFNDALLVDISDLNKEYDVIFIDAAKAQYTKFFNKFEVLLKKGGIVFSDNLKFHGLVGNSKESLSKNLKNLVKKIEDYNLFLRENERFLTTFLDIGDGIAISIKK